MWTSWAATQAVDIEHITLSLVTRVEVENGDQEHDRSVEFYRAQVARSMTLPEGQRQSIPFSLHVPWETPITDVYGRHLHGMTMGVRTELAIARAVDKGDIDPLQVNPLPAQEAVLDAMGRLGFRFRSADLERGHIRGSRQTLPFYQEIEFDAAPQYAHACSQVELTFVTDPHAVGVVLEVDKRGGLFSGGHDVYHSFQVPHAGGDGTDWAQVIDAWFQRDVLPYGRGHGGAHGYEHHGHHGHPGTTAPAWAGWSRASAPGSSAAMSQARSWTRPSRATKRADHPASASLPRWNGRADPSVPPPWTDRTSLRGSRRSGRRRPIGSPRWSGRSGGWPSSRRSTRTTTSTTRRA